MPSKLTETARSEMVFYRPHQDELRELSELCGIHMDVHVFRTLVQLINLGVDPDTIYTVLKCIRRSLYRSRAGSVSSSSSVRSTARSSMAGKNTH